jgi:site-specific DNA-cytosine methylase
LRGSTVEHYFAMIRALMPRFFVFENVRGLLSVAIKHRPYNERIAREKEAPARASYGLGSDVRCHQDTMSPDAAVPRTSVQYSCLID